MPQRIIVNSRSGSTLRTTGASISGKIPGSGGKFPVVSIIARVNSRIAWLPFETL